MNFLEKDLEQIIFEADRKSLSERGLHLNGKMYRQLKIGNYGIADLVCIDRCYNAGYYPEKIIPKIDITIIELKKDNVNISAFMQAIAYLKGISRYIEKNRNINFDISYRIILIGKTIDLNSSICYLPEMIPLNNDSSSFLDMYTYDYGLEGLKFKDIFGYSLINEGF